MSKMKHLLRKLHIGGGSGGGALTEQHHHHHHHHRTVTDHTERTAATPTPLPLQQPSTSAVSGQTTASATPSLESLDNSNSSISSNGNATTANAADFSFLEEEFQVQLALAISVSDPDSREDPETSAQITAAKQISLGCSTSQSIVDLLSLRYWVPILIFFHHSVINIIHNLKNILLLWLRSQLHIHYGCQIISHIICISHS